MMRVEKEMLLHEMHTKDDAHTKELAEMTAGATLCNTLQHTATHCDTRHCKTLQRPRQNPRQ